MNRFSIADVTAESITAANPQLVKDALSHELRTPLNGIVGTIELLEHTGLSTEQLDLVAALKTSAEALAKIICAYGETPLGPGNHTQILQLGPATFGTPKTPTLDLNGQAVDGGSVPTTPEGTIQQRPTRLLLVDDNPINLVVLGAMLMKAATMWSKHMMAWRP